MKILQKIALALVFMGSLMSLGTPVFADLIFTPTGSTQDLDLQNGKKSGVTRQDYTDNFVGGVEGSMNSTFGNTFRYFRASNTGEKWAYALLINIARDAKNVFIFVAIVYLVISVLRILLSGGSDEDAKKWRNTILWTTVGIVVMQSAFVAVDTLYNRNITGFTAMLFADKLIYPFVHLLEIFASFAFIAMAIFSFYRIVTAGGDEEGVKSGKKTILYAIAGFLLIKVPGTLIKAIYGEARCDTPLIFSICRLNDPQISGAITIFTTIINYMNGFLALLIVILIIYAGFLVLTSGGDEDKMKKAKGIVKYIVIGILLLVTSYILFNFFLQKG